MGPKYFYHVTSKLSLIFETSGKMKYILLSLLLFCTAIPAYCKVGDKLIDCYLCSDYKDSEWFKEYYKSLRSGLLSSFNDTHDRLTWINWLDIRKNATVISTPCKGYKSDIVKCPYCTITYDRQCKICKLHTLKQSLSTNLTNHCCSIERL